MDKKFYMFLQKTLKQLKNLSVTISSFIVDNTALKKLKDTLSKNSISLKIKIDNPDHQKNEALKKPSVYPNITNPYSKAASASSGSNFDVGDSTSDLSKWINIGSMITYSITSLKKMKDEVIKLDSSIVKLEKTSNLSSSHLQSIIEKAYVLSDKYAKTVSEVLDTITVFKRAGYEIADSIAYAEEALLASNISPSLKEAGQAAGSLITIMKGFKEESPEFARHINDAISHVADTEAIDFDSLIEGAARLSETAGQAGMSFEQMLGILAGAYEVLGNIENVSTGQISIVTRLQGKQDNHGSGISGMANLKDTFHTATNGAVTMIDQNTGQLRNVYDILNDLSNVWDTLDKKSQESLALEAAGTDQKNVFLAMMSNWKSVEEAVASAADSIGSADAQNKEHLEDLQKRIDILNASFQKLSQTILSSDLLKFLVDFGAVGTTALDSLFQHINPLIAAFGGLYAYINKGEFKKRFCPSWG